MSGPRSIVNPGFIVIIIVSVAVHSGENEMSSIAKSLPPPAKL